jgi:hypothetical protein
VSRTRAPRRLGVAELRPVVETLFARRPEAVLALLRAVWPQVVGPATARRTELTSVDQGVMRVRVPDARWRDTLFRMEASILERLSALAGRCAPRRLGFMVGTLSQVDTPKAIPEPAVRRQQVEPDPSVENMARVIPDPELRQAFIACASIYLRSVAGRRGRVV